MHINRVVSKSWNEMSAFRGHAKNKIILLAASVPPYLSSVTSLSQNRDAHTFLHISFKPKWKRIHIHETEYHAHLRNSPRPNIFSDARQDAMKQNAGRISAAICTRATTSIGGVPGAGIVWVGLPLTFRSPLHTIPTRKRNNVRCTANFSSQI